jgi:hypothetical protein
MLNILAIAGIVLGGIYLVLAMIAPRRSQVDATPDGEEAGGKLVLSFEENPLIEEEPTPERMKKLAAYCASGGRRFFGEELDYSVESIPRLERVIVAGWGKGEDNVSENAILAIGAYLGEILVRRTRRGRWVSGITDREPASVMFLSKDDDAISVTPFLLAREKFEKLYSFDLAIAFTALEQKLRELKAV